ncbi:MAG: hypothetical protein UIM53_02780 [Acutalibacteraceae bacterium]|nr:hypothetical protein [Acutalibacteraceae bacterium]
MGQRSQIYIRYQKEKQVYNQKTKRCVMEPDGHGLIALYFGWNYGERMISRARYTMEWLEEYAEYPYEIEKKASRIAETNFDMIDVLPTSDIVKEWQEWEYDSTFRDFVFENQDNNNGQLYIDVMLDGTIKYAFTHPYAENEILDAKGYMKVDDENWETSEYITDEGKEKNRKNMQWIEENAKLMTDEELENFKNYDYGFQKTVKDDE